MARRSTPALAFAIDPPKLVPCLDVPNQIAQKLHACTEPLPDGNERVEPWTSGASLMARLATYSQRRAM